MKRLLAAFMVLMAPARALACSCAEPEGEAERRQYARYIAGRAIAIVEAEPVSGPEIRRQIGETYRIAKVIAGDAKPGPIRMARSFGRDPRTGEVWMGGSSCDVLPGFRKRVLLLRTGYAPAGGGAILPAVPGAPCGHAQRARVSPAGRDARGYVPVFSFGGSCEDWFLGSPGALELVREEARKLGRPIGR